MDEQEQIETTEKLFTRLRYRKYRDWIRVGIHLFIIGLFLVLFSTHSLDQLENLVLDGFLKHTGFHKVHPAIAVIEISDESIGEVGKWPWPRRYHAVLARLLSDWGAAAIFFDFNFPNETFPQDDRDLTQALQKIKTPFYLPLDLRPRKEKKFWLHGLPIVLDKNEGETEWIHSLPGVEEKAKALGHRELETDPDGTLRYFKPYLSDGDQTLPFLALPAAYDLMGKAAPEKEDLIKLAGPGGKILIPWISGWQREFVRYDCADLIHSFYGIQKGMEPRIPPGEIEGKLCLIGVTSPTNFETKATSLGNAVAPLIVQAHVINSILTGQWIRIASAPVNAILLIVIGIAATVLFLVFRGAGALLAGLFLGLGWQVFCFLCFYFFHIWLFSVYPIFLILALFIFSSIYAQLTATREQSALFHLATRDGLTELYVIRHFRLIMNQIVREAFTRKEPLSIILLDVDHFKKINDTYGHPAGDMVLKKVSGILLNQIRKKRPFSQIDFAARYGGEEFIIMLRKAGLEKAAWRVGERIRKKIQEAVFEWEGKHISVTASAGVATLHPGENVPDPMVHRADAALYQAKREGRNRVCAEKSDPLSP